MPDMSNGVRLPAAERLAAALLGRIERGEYAPGEWLPTERELAAEFRADRSTIRSALSSLAAKDLIVRETGRRPRVSLRPADEAGDQNSREAKVALQTLAVLSPQTPHYPASPSIQRGVLQVLINKEAPYRLIVFDNNAETRAETIRRERRALESIRNEGISGVIVWHQGNLHTLPDLRLLQEAGIPMVLVDRCDPSFACDFVGIDNSAAAREAVTHLLDLGHQRVMHLTMDDPTITVRDREQGYRDAMMSHGIRPEPDWTYRMSNAVHLQPPVTSAADHFLGLAERPTAVFVLNDLIAHEFMTELQARGVRVPEDISIMGFDDMDRHSLRPSPLTTVHQPFEQMGEKAVDLLLTRLAQPAGAPVAHRHILLPTRLVIRTSCIPLLP
ncbi:LacI family transcriptional regulator [Capsulimonas corticalis]|uniref:LacI family transcriptional regulator n=1 Tax=Capsulimonas corticalis TaxID=2219043 RepID=A0A402D3Z4_9BACT|nr:GntR family transcriptional regulator [Capsulimonas corticalis]BDI31191.1 LacI family transcriptional regulator [Capsulimonas corticalis]